MVDSMERLERLARVEPPAELDRLVHERLGVAVALERSNREREAGAEAQARRRDGKEGPGPGLPLPLPERLVYLAGLLAYGSQALGAVARLVWRVVSG
jgi:hypothetical protein